MQVAKGADVAAQNARKFTYDGAGKDWKLASSFSFRATYAEWLCLARCMLRETVSKTLGVIFVLVGAVLMYFGWQAHEVVSASSATLVGETAEGSHSIWMLMVGAIAAVWGLAVLLRRRA